MDNIFIASTGLLPELPYSKRHISSNVVVIILSLCVIIITVAFFILVVCYLCQRDKCRVRAPIISLDKQISYNSLTNLISHRSSSTPDSKVMMDSPVNNIKGVLVLLGFIVFHYFWTWLNGFSTKHNDLAFTHLSLLLSVG